MNLIISTQELYTLVKNNKQNNILVVDARSFSEYKKGHLLGAINVDLFQLHWFDTTTRGIKAFNRQCRLLLSNIGVRKGSRVVFYDNISGISAPRGVWLLLYFGHGNEERKRKKDEEVLEALQPPPNLKHLVLGKN